MRRTWNDAGAASARRPRARCCPPIVDSQRRDRRGDRAARRTADRRARRRPAGVAGRPGLRAPGQAKITFGTGGMLDLCTGADAPDRSAPQRRTARSRSSPGRRDGEPTWGAEAIMLSAGTNVEWLRDDLGIIADAGREPRRRRRVRRRPTACATCRRCSASARRTGTTAPAARCSASPAARAGRRSCAPCSKASPSVAPTWSRPPRPTPGSRSRRCASTAG